MQSGGVVNQEKVRGNIVRRQIYGSVGANTYGGGADTYDSVGYERGM